MEGETMNDGAEMADMEDDEETEAEDGKAEGS